MHAITSAIGKDYTSCFENINCDGFVIARISLNKSFIYKAY